MKNFRKVLALVLVVATLLSFATMASADYKDQASIDAKYELAVDVLSGFGIISGDDKGNFRPNDEIDRDEVAKMVAVLCNGGEDIEAYYADACTFADTKNTWAAGYVAYCYHTGIIDGRNATTFDPNASITGYEVAKMILCVLGFDADEQGYVGKDWKVNVLRDARNFGLLDELDKSFSLKNNIKRQEVAQMILTALKKPVVVGVLSDNIVKITNALYAGWNISIKDLGIGEFSILYGNVIVSDDCLLEVYDYGWDVVVDCFGRPYMVWAGENAVTGKEWSITRPIAQGAAVGAKLAADTYVFLNGQYIATVAKGTETKTDAWKNLDLARAGLVVETYHTAAGTIVAAFETEVAVAGTPYKYQGVTYVDIDFANAKWEDITEKNTAGYKGGEILFATFCDGTDKTHGAKLSLKDRIAKATAKFGVEFEVAAPVAVKVTDVTSNTERYPANWNQTNTTFWSGKTAYDYHEANIAGYYAGGQWAPAAYMDEAAIGKTYNVYMNNGYVIAWTPYVAADTAEYGVAYFEGDSWYAIEGDKYVNGVRPLSYYIDDMIDFNAKEHDGVLVSSKENVVDVLDYFKATGILAQYKVKDGKLSLIEGVPFRSNSIDIAKGEVGGINAYQIVNSTKILVKVGGKYEAHTWDSLKATYGNLLLSGTYNVQYFVNGQKVTYLFVEATAVVEDGYFFIVDWNETRTSDQIKKGERVWVEEYKAIVNGQNVTMWFDVDFFEDNEAGVAKEDLIGGLFNIKVRYLGVTIDGEPIYYVSDDAQLLEIVPVEFDHIDSGKIFSGNEGATVELHLADKYAITVIDYTELDADEDGNADKTADNETKIKFVGLKGVYTNEADFNAEFKDNDGYYYAAYVETDAAGYVTNLFLVRIAEV